MSKKLDLKPNVYEIVSRAVEAGARFGVHRAFKHTETPEREAIVAQVESEVMLALSEVVRLD